MKIYGVFNMSSLSEDIQKKYLENPFNGIEVDWARKILKVEYIYDKKTQEIKKTDLVNSLGEPNYFQISIKIPDKVFVIGLIEKGFTMPISGKDGKFLLININEGTTAVEYFNRRLRATYFGFRKQENMNFVIEYPRYEIKIPYFLDSKEKAREFLNANSIPYDIGLAFEKISSYLSFKNDFLKNKQDINFEDGMGWI